MPTSVILISFEFKSMCDFDFALRSVTLETPIEQHGKKEKLLNLKAFIMCDVSETFYISLKPKNATNNSEKEKPTVLAGHPVCNYSFVDKLWQFEIAGGKDQNAPLTVINVGKNGLAKRSGIKIGDEVAFINNLSTENMTLKEAQIEILDAGRSLKIIVRG